MDTQASPHTVDAQSVVDAGMLSWVSPFVFYLSGIVFLQYANFYQHVRRKKCPSFGLATMIITTHVAQLCLELWTTWEALISSYLSGLQFSYALSQALEVWSSAIIVLLVQYHFCRIAYAMTESKHWIIVTGALCIATFIAAFGAASQFANYFRQVGSHVSAPIVPNVPFLVSYIGWQALGCLSDVVISLKLGIALYGRRSSARHRSIRCLLGRLLAVTINTFSLTALAACCSLMCIALPYAVRMSITSQGRLQAAGFIINRAQPRVYITSFFLSLGRVEDSQSQCFESHVASMELCRIRSNLDLRSMRSVNLRAPDSPSPNHQVHSVKIQITQKVEVVIEDSCEKGGNQAQAGIGTK